jgi:ankyrin repeat protein
MISAVGSGKKGPLRVTAEVPGSPPCATVERGADPVTAVNEDMDIPLHMPADFGRRVIAELPLERGSDLNARNADNETARELACANELKDVVKALE